MTDEARRNHAEALRLATKCAKWVSQSSCPRLTPAGKTMLETKTHYANLRIFVLTGADHWSLLVEQTNAARKEAQARRIQAENAQDADARRPQQGEPRQGLQDHAREQN